MDALNPRTIRLDTPPSSDEESDDSSDDESSDVTVDRVPRKRYTKGESHRGLKVLRASYPLYKRFLDYGYYRLKRKSHRCKGRDTAEVKHQVTRMALTLRNYTFSGEDPIMVLDLLRRFCDEANTLNMSEAQAYVALSYFLKGFALDQFQTVKDAYAASEGGVTCWPEAVQYLIRSYATSNAIGEAIISLRNIRQKPTEFEMEYSARLNQAELRCGNVHAIAEKITMFISGLNPAIEPLITCVREEPPSRSYLELVQIARDLGDAFRAKGGNAVKRHPLLKEKSTVGTRNTLSSALLASSADELWGHKGLHHAFESNVDPLQMMTEAEDSIPTTDLSCTESEISHLQEVDPMLAMGYRTVPALRLAFQRESSSADNRPGWKDRRVRRKTLEWD